MPIMPTAGEVQEAVKEEITKTEYVSQLDQAKQSRILLEGESYFRDVKLDFIDLL